jgi:hypothetical protein
MFKQRKQVAANWIITFNIVKPEYQGVDTVGSKYLSMVAIRNFVNSLYD